MEDERTSQLGIGNHNQSKPKCVVGLRDDCEPTGNQPRRGCMSCGHNRCGGHEAPNPDTGNSHARRHDNLPRPEARDPKGTEAQSMEAVGCQPKVK